MEFKCWECSFETDDEDLIVYCDDCDHTMCEIHTHTIYHQGFDEVLCSKCKTKAVKPKWLSN